MPMNLKSLKKILSFSNLLIFIMIDQRIPPLTRIIKFSSPNYKHHTLHLMQQLWSNLYRRDSELTNLPTPISINILPPTVHPASIAIYPCHVALSATSVHALSLRFLIDPKKRLPLIVNLRISPNFPSGFIDHRRISFPTRSSCIHSRAISRAKISRKCDQSSLPSPFPIQYLPTETVNRR